MAFGLGKCFKNYLHDDFLYSIFSVLAPFELLLLCIKFFPDYFSRFLSPLIYFFHLFVLLYSSVFSEWLLCSFLVSVHGYSIFLNFLDIHDKLWKIPFSSVVSLPASSFSWVLQFYIRPSLRSFMVGTPEYMCVAGSHRASIWWSTEAVCWE